MQPELHPSLTSPASLSSLLSIAGLPARAPDPFRQVQHLSQWCVRCVKESARTRCVAQISSCGQCSPIWLMACCISR